MVNIINNIAHIVPTISLIICALYICDLLFTLWRFRLNIHNKDESDLLDLYPFGLEFSSLKKHKDNSLLYELSVRTIFVVVIIFLMGYQFQRFIAFILFGGLYCLWVIWSIVVTITRMKNYSKFI